MDSILKYDIFGRSLIHILAITNDVQNFIKLLKLISKSNSHHLLLIDDVENNWNILHYSIYYFNFSFVKTILNSNIPVINKLLNHKDKNNLTPFDLLNSLLTSFKFSNNIIYSISQHGDYKYKSSTEQCSNNTNYYSSSLLISLPSGDYANVNLLPSLFPPPSPNPLLKFKISSLVSCSTHTALITSSGELYISNPNSALSNSSFCRIKFFDDLLKKGEKVVDVALTSNHTVVLTSWNKIYSFGTNIKRLNFYNNAIISSQLTPPNSAQAMSPSSSSTSSSTGLSTLSSNEYSKDFNSIIPIQISIKQSSNSTISSNSSTTNSSLLNSFNALSSLRDLDSSSNVLNSNPKFKLKGITSSNNHTVAFSDSTLHIFGLNVGQFGPLINSIYASNKKSEPSSNIASFAHLNWKYTDDLIDQVLALDLTTIVITKSSLIHLYTSGLHVTVSLPFTKDIKNNWNSFKPRILSMPKKIKKIISPVFNDGSDKSNSAGNLNSTYSIYLLLDSGEVSVFTFPRYSASKEAFNEAVKITTIWKPSRSEMKAVDVSIGDCSSSNNSIGAVICTVSGDAFKKTKAKWARINDISNITKVSTGFGFSIPGVYNTNNDENKCKTILLRDEIVQLNHEIKPPGIIEDFGTLSPLSKIISKEVEENAYLKNSDTDFFANLNSENSTIRHSELESDHDIKYFDKFNGLTFSKHLKPSSYKSDYKNIIDIFQSEESFCTSMLFNNENLFRKENFEKSYDYEIKIKNTSSNLEIQLDVHKLFLFTRMGITSNTYSLERRDLLFQFNESNALIVGNIDIRSVALFLHMLYTEETIDVWNMVEGLDPTVKNGWDRLLYTFPKANFIDVIRSLYSNASNNQSVDDDDDDNDGDVIIKLSDGEIKTWKYLLSCRCDYFKQLFSKYWKSTNVVDFLCVSKRIWLLVMNYILGDSNDELFYNSVKQLIAMSLRLIESKQLIKKKSNKFVNSTLSDLDNDDNLNDNFINIILELTYLANELLLPNLKELCELAIKDCINFDNYDIILRHSFDSDSNQLFSNCVWYIFNNLSLCYRDPRTDLKNLDDSCITLLESRIHQLVNIYLPHRKSLKSTKNNKKGKPILNDLDNFLNDIDTFNDFYLHPLLWDIFGVTEKEILKHKVKTRKLSRATIPVVTKTFQSKSNSSSAQSFSELLETKKQLSNFSVDNESVIDDDDTSTNSDANDGFIAIQKGRRQSSTSNLLRNSSVSNSWVPNRTYSNSSLNNINVNEPWKIKRPGKSPETTNDSDSSLANEGSSINSCSLDEILLNKTQKKSTSKVKVSAPLRISQKERKQKERQEIDRLANTTSNTGSSSNKSPWNVSNAWGASTPKVIEGSSNMELVPEAAPKRVELNTATLLAPKKISTGHFPSIDVLTKSQKKKPLNPIIDNPRSIIETRQPYSITPNIIQETKSLEDIKAEEEFAKWWEEESKRVQNEMNGNSNRSTHSNSNKHRNGKNSGRGGNGGGSRGNRGRGNNSRKHN